MKALLFLLCCLLSYSTAFLFQGTDLAWSKLNSKEPVCFEGRYNKPGIFKPKCEGFLAAVKLVHLNGSIVCGQLCGSHTSNWGCNEWPELVETPLNVVVTDEYDHIVFPKAGARFKIGVHERGKWYSVPGFDSRSKYLVLQHSFDAPLYVGPKSELRVWYAEDLLNYYDTDNIGRVCLDVYGLCFTPSSPSYLQHELKKSKLNQ